MGDPFAQAADPSSGLETVSVEELSQELRTSGEEAFRAKHPHPFLLVKVVPTGVVDDVEPDTIETDLKNLKDKETLRLHLRVIPVAKTNRNAFGSKITVGRARNNDIVIRATKISRLHAVFVPGEEGMTLVDMGSANGTLRNGVPLTKNIGMPVQSGDVVGFWSYVFEYTSLDDFVRLLGRLR